MVTCCAGCKGTACPTKDGTVQWESGSERTNGVDYWIAALASGAKPRLLGRNDGDGWVRRRRWSRCRQASPVKRGGAMLGIDKSRSPCSGLPLTPTLSPQERGEGVRPWSAQAMEEDAQRLAEFERTRMGVPRDEIKALMKSWGKPNELPPSKSGVLVCSRCACDAPTACAKSPWQRGSL